MSKLKEKILSSAYARYASQGQYAVTLRSIAKDLGVTHPAVYTYFQNKDELFANLRIQTWSALKVKLFSQINHHGTFKSIMQRIGENFIEYFEQNPADFSLLFLQPEQDIASRESQLQILEYIDQLLMLPEQNINLPQIYWYMIIGHAYAWHSKEITKTKFFELLNEAIDRLGRTQ